ncbi:MAG: hypothetical protein KA010_02355 [Saprospiraceae bacterium]|nr:hypothetical protein [Saprospiraceae bacterium]
MRHNYYILFFILFLINSKCLSQNAEQAKSSNASEHIDKKWYDVLSIKGYAQLRYNGLFNTNQSLTCDQCDKSWGNNAGFFFRRLRLTFAAQLTNKITFILQPDFVSASGTSLNFTQLRDAYFDIGLSKDNEFRVRIGQNRVPYGLENMQSSQIRLPLDRDDALNSASVNERDMGIFFYWTPLKYKKLLTSMVKDGYKGYGDHGLVAVGVYNGQATNSADKNQNKHVVARLTYPFEIGNQVVEASLQGYTGKYVLPSVSAGVGVHSDLTYIDQRAAASLLIYPKPFGIQAEYNIGKGPEFNKFTDSIEVRNLKGGYVMLFYRIKTKKDYTITPFTRAQYYEGGKKYELDARSYKVNDYEIGLEWEFNKHFELVGTYTISQRRYEDYKNKDNTQKGNLLRLQAQFAF